MRTAVVSVRLTAVEKSAWLVGVYATGHRSLGWWARSVVESVVAASEGARPGAVGLPRIAPGADYFACSGTADQINRWVRAAHTTGEITGEMVAGLRPLVGSLCAIRVYPSVVPNVQGYPPVGLRVELVNVRLSPDELARWRKLARTDGWERVSGWVRAVVGAQVGFRIRPAGGAPTDPVFEYLRKQLSGAVVNLSQLVGSDYRCAAADRDNLDELLGALQGSLLDVRAVAAG